MLENLKKKIQERKDVRIAKKSPDALKNIEIQTEAVIWAAFDRFGPKIVQYIKNLTPELYGRLETECYDMYETHVFSHIPKEKLTQDICIEAARQSIYLFSGIPEEFRNYEVYLECVKHNGDFLENTPKEYQTPEMYKAAVECRADALKWIPAEAQTDEICKLAFNKNKQRVRRGWIAVNLLQYIHNQTEELCLLGVEQTGMSLKDAKFKTDEVCLAAVHQNGLALQFVENQTKEICFEAVDNDRKALMYIKDKDVAQLAALYANSKAE